MKPSQPEQNTPQKDEGQISFRLPVEEKNKFAGLVKGSGKDSTKLLREFVRLYTESGGDLRLLMPTDPRADAALKAGSSNGDPALRPHSQEERLLVAGLLLLFRDKRAIASGVKELVAGLLANWISKAKALLEPNGERSA